MSHLVNELLNLASGKIYTYQENQVSISGIIIDLILFLSGRYVEIFSVT